MAIPIHLTNLANGNEINLCTGDPASDSSGPLTAAGSTLDHTLYVTPKEAFADAEAPVSSWPVNVRKGVSDTRTTTIDTASPPTVGTPLSISFSTTGAINAMITAPYSNAYSYQLLTSGGTLAASGTSAASPFLIDTLEPGTYRLWVSASDPTGKATPPRRSGELTVTAGLTSVANLSIGALIGTAAGNGSLAYGGDDGDATEASLKGPTGLAIDTAGNLFIADRGNHRVRKVNTAGIITTVAGTGTPGSGGNWGVATSAQFSYPSGVAVSGSGKLFIADEGNNMVRYVEGGGVAIAAGTGGLGNFLTSPSSVAVDGSDNLYITEPSIYRVETVNGAYVVGFASNGCCFGGDGGPAGTAQLSTPRDVAVDASGNVYIADSGNHRVRMVVMAAGTYFGQVRSSGDVGRIFTVAGSAVAGFAGDGGLATSASLNAPNGVAVDKRGNLFIADTSNGRVRMVNSAGIISTIAGGGVVSGNGGLATSALLLDPMRLVVDDNGVLYIAETSGNRVRKLD